MKRIVLFVATNVAVLAVIYLVLNILGVERIVTADGTRLDLGALLTFSAVVGFTGPDQLLDNAHWVTRTMLCRPSCPVWPLGSRGLSNRW